MQSKTAIQLNWEIQSRLEVKWIKKFIWIGNRIANWKCNPLACETSIVIRSLQINSTESRTLIAIQSLDFIKSKHLSYPKNWTYFKSTIHFNWGSDELMNSKACLESGNKSWLKLRFTWIKDLNRDSNSPNHSIETLVYIETWIAIQSLDFNKSNHWLRLENRTQFKYIYDSSELRKWIMM